MPKPILLLLKVSLIHCSRQKALLLGWVRLAPRSGDWKPSGVHPQQQRLPLPLPRRLRVDVRQQRLLVRRHDARRSMRRLTSFNGI